jgi:hypothetical protein
MMGKETGSLSGVLRACVVSKVLEPDGMGCVSFRPLRSGGLDEGRKRVLPIAARIAQIVPGTPRSEFALSKTQGTITLLWQNSRPLTTA